MDYSESSSKILKDFVNFNSDSDDELDMLFDLREAQDEQTRGRRQHGHRGSIVGNKFVGRNHIEAHNQIWNDYFSPTPLYDEFFFRRRYRLSRNLFLHVLDGVVAHDPYFQFKSDAVGNPGLSSIQKITAAMRILAYGNSAESLDEYIKIGKSTSLECLRRFVKAVIAIFGEKYLRAPNQADVTRLLQKNEEREFPGMLGSIDCMHWEWKNCPTAWQGMYTGHCQEPTIILEVVASHDLWIWHAFFGMPGSLNDINVLQRSPVFDTLTTGRAPTANYTINNHNYDMGYYLADGIYPRWSTFVKTIPCPRDRKSKLFAKMQESARKDVERAFGVLQARFAITRGQARLWDVDSLSTIMTACIILHNMIVEENHGVENVDFTGYTEPPIMSRSHTTQYFIQRHRDIRDASTHSQLQADLMVHLWDRFGSFG